MMIEVRSRSGWNPVDTSPEVGELDRFEIRGHSRHATIHLGNVAVTLEHPIASVRLSDIPDLQCHVGLLAVTVDGVIVGELNVRPDKLTAERWERLRRDLDAVWTGLVLDDPAPTALEATGPDPNELWHRLSPVVAQLVDQPVTTLGFEERWLRSERIRSASQLTVSVALSTYRGQPGRARVVAPVVAEPERALVRDCLLRLQAYARRHPRGRAVASGVSRILSAPLLIRPASSAVAVTHMARHDSRLRQVVAIRQVLLNTSSLITEGPGELRLGVKSLDKLYEYWVFLQVLSALRAEFGEPLGTGFESLAVRLSGGRLRLELPAGTSVEFPGGIHAVYTPRITQSGRNSWQQLELVPTPSSLGRPTPSSVEPDIVVFHAGRNEAIVIDAKYRARHVVDQALAEVHGKYGRFRLRGIGVVTDVVVAHPHEHFRLRWAGQRAIPMVPGESNTDRLWPDSWALVQSTQAPEDDPLVREESPQPVKAAPEEIPAAPADPVPIEVATSASSAQSIAVEPPTQAKTALAPAPVPERPFIPISEIGLVICDQQWTALAVGDRRLDLLTLRQLSSNGKPSFLVGSNQGKLQSFQDAAHHRGWNVVVAITREEVLEQVTQIVQNSKARAVAVISGNDDVIELVRSLNRRVDVINQLDEFR